MESTYLCSAKRFKFLVIGNECYSESAVKRTSDSYFKQGLLLLFFSAHILRTFS